MTQKIPRLDGKGAAVPEALPPRSSLDLRGGPDWRRQNARAIAVYNTMVERRGVFSDGRRMF